LDIALSLFPAQTYFWGDVHRNIFLGPRRAARICPAKSALNNKIRFTLHSDAPVTPLSPYGVFQIIWSAVNRITLSGKVLGPDQRIPVY
jgi:predicted amidohydrolase YtcJ